MNPRHERLANCLMHCAMPRDPAHALKLIRLYFHDKMALPAFLVSGVATMALAIVDHLQPGRLQRGFEPIMNFLCHGHFFL